MEFQKKTDRMLDTLSVFSALGNDDVYHALRQFLYAAGAEEEHTLEAYGNFCGALYSLGHTDNWTEYLTKLILSHENACSWYASQRLPIPHHIERAARMDLRKLSLAASMTSEQALSGIETDGLEMPQWHAEAVDLEQAYFAWLSDIHKHGFGDYALYKMFHMELSDKNDKGYVLEPVEAPDAVGLNDLIGYEMQRAQVIANTQALLKGLKASNILLSGDAGTGKSATVKAVANAYAEEGLRLVELSKKELHLLPRLLEELSINPLKFILFVDDLSFQDNDDDFSALKAVLEGSISARSNNTVIYATSNRRHIVRETFSQRSGDEIHRNDTMQETISLSERFGIKIYYDKPNKQLYLDIVKGLAEQYGLAMDAETLAAEAEKFAIRRSGRSARAARQLVEQLVCSAIQREKGVIDYVDT